MTGTTSEMEAAASRYTTGTSPEAEEQVHGRRSRLMGNHRIVLADPERGWLVREGVVDVFGVRMEGGVPRGARRHYLTVSAGCAFFGMPSGADEGVVLIAVAAGSVEVEQLTLDGLKADAWGDPARAVQLIDDFVGSLARVVADADPRQIATILTPGDKTVSLPAGRRAGSRRIPVWVRAKKGRFSFEGLTLGPDTGFFPLAHGAWIEGTTAIELECVDTATYLRSEPAWPAFDVFRQVLLEWITADTDAQERGEIDRLRDKTRAARRIRHEALLGLLSLSSDRRRNRRVGSGGDLLLAACQMIGRMQRINFQPPPAWERKRGGTDPLAAICRASGVRSRQIALTGEWWKRDGGPILAFREGNPVALRPEGRRGYTLIDPSDGRSTLVTADLARTLDNFGQVFYRPLPDRVLTIKDLLGFAFEEMRLDLGLVAMLAVLSAALGMLLPAATGFMFRTVVPTADVGQLGFVFVGLVSAGLGGAALDLTRGFVILRMNGRSAVTMEAALFDRLLKLPATFFRRYTIGDLVQRMQGIGMIRTLFSGSAVAALLGCITGAFNFGLMFWYDWKLALVATGFTFVAAGFLGACTLASIREQGRIQEISGKLSGLVFQLISGVAKLRVAGAEDRAIATWSKVYVGSVRERDKAARTQALVTVFNDSFPLMNSLIIFGGVGLLASKGWGRIDTAAFIAFNSAMGIFLASAIQTTNTVVNLAQVVPLLRRAAPILVTQPEVPLGKPNPGELAGEIEGRHLSFRYAPDGPLILDDISFSAESGDFIAFVGPSGSGKSTTLRLLLGFEAPETGAIYFDGKDITDLDIGAVRRQMGVVLQSSRVMSGSVFKNIVGSAPLTQEQAWEAAEMAGLADDVKAMPMGMHTVVSEGGSTLSGGQRQRLLIARALVHKPRIILFDEATSALDNRTQQIVSDALDSIHATRFVIAHRLSTIRHADRIYLMEAGRIIESGSYEELMAVRGRFAQLAARQLV